MRAARVERVEGGVEVMEDLVVGLVARCDVGRGRDARDDGVRVGQDVDVVAVGGFGGHGGWRWWW